jgi:hypothetical protein
LIKVAPLLLGANNLNLIEAVILQSFFVNRSSGIVNKSIFGIDDLLLHPSQEALIVTILSK